MIDRNGFEFYGETAFQKLGLDVSEACVNQKEDVLFAICTERYPTFCGQCQGYTKAQDCPAWEAMSGKDRLEILMNIRQEVAIHYLNEQSKLHGQAIYGGESCKVHCLTAANDTEVRNLLGNLISPSPSSSSSASCGQDEWKSCGLYGVTYSLAINDVNLAKNIQNVNNQLASEIQALRVDFQSEKKAVASRFGILESEINQKIDQLKSLTEKRFKDVARSMAGLGTASGPEVAKELSDKATLVGTIGLEQAAKKLAVYNVLTDAFKKEHAVISLLFDSDIDQTLLLTREGLGPLSFEIVREIMDSINFSPTNRASFDIEIANGIKSSCGSHMTENPGLSLFGRGSGELLAIAYLRSLILGPKSSTIANNAIFFNLNTLGSSNSFQQNYVAEIFDYRSDPSINVTQNCLEAVHKVSTDVLLNSQAFSNQRKTLQSNLTLKRISELIHSDMKKILDQIGSLDASLIVENNGRLSDQFYRTLSHRMIDLAISQRRYDIAQNEVENLISIQRELSESNNFQTEFEAHLKTFRDAMSDLKSGMEANRKQIAIEVEQREIQNRELQQQVGSIKDAMGYVAALAAADPLATKEIRDRVNSAANIDQKIQDLIKDIQASHRFEQPFTPAIRTVSSGTVGNPTTCWGNVASLENLPANSAFTPNFGGTNCFRQWNPTTPGQMQTITFRVWGSAHKLLFRHTGNGTRFEADLRKPNSLNPVLGRVAGNFREGVFDIQTVGLSFGWGNNPVSITPVYVSPSGVEEVGQNASRSFNAVMNWDPLVLDFSNSGHLKTVAPSNSNVFFDLTGSNMKYRVGWLSDRRAGFLALDLNGNGQIDGTKELFSDFTKIYNSGKYAENGYEALRQYDMNQDGIIDHQDPIYNRLIVWFDENSNGLSESNELKSLSEVEVTSISLNYRELKKSDQMKNDNRFMYQAKFFGPKSCGSVGCSTYDIYFGTHYLQKEPSILSQK
jgi:hypothetical protein